MNFNEVLKKISFETFSNVIDVSPRKVRESLYSHFGVKTKSRLTLTNVKQKKQQRIKQLHEALMKVTNPKERDFIKELFRNWLLHQRPLLKETLDFLEVENDFGFVEIKTDFFKELTKEKVAALLAHLQGKFAEDSILIYLTFMEVPHLDNLSFT